MAKRLTRYILIALVLGLIAGWAINAAIEVFMSTAPRP